MGSRRLRPMTAADLPSLPASCARCTFWEASLSDLAAPTDHVDRQAMKAEWAEIVTAHWGYCGVVAFAEDQPIGHLTLAPRCMCRDWVPLQQPRSVRTPR